MCFTFPSMNYRKKKHKVSYHYRPTHPLGQAGYPLARIPHVSQAISMFLCCLPLLARLPACMPACLLSLARIRCRLAGLPCHLPRFRDDQFAATLCLRRATPCSCLTIRERGRERKGKGGRDREREAGREGRERKREGESRMAGRKRCLSCIRMAD